MRFLLVHHTASRNGYRQQDVPALLRGFFSFHTGPDKVWPDLAYNFLVDEHGGVWDRRAGSLAGPVRPSATGGSQGFAVLGCYIGDLAVAAPRPPARASMLRLLAWLADTYGIDTAPGARHGLRLARFEPVAGRDAGHHRDDRRAPGTCP